MLRNFKNIKTSNSKNELYQSDLFQVEKEFPKGKKREVMAEDFFYYFMI